MAAVETANKSELLAKLKKQLANIEPLEDEKDFFEKDETLLRFLKARDWDVKEAEKQLLATIEWRREKSPLTMDCRWCHETPGYHSMRQVGFDEVGRPVIYSCFSQAETHKNIPEDSIAHCTYLIENATRSMKPGVTTWVFIIDCTGMTLPACNPRLGYYCTQIMSSFYPERLGMVVCVNHSALFSGVFKAIKVFLPPHTTSKMRMINSKKKLLELFECYFSDELTHWLLQEIKLNKSKQLAVEQKLFWQPVTAPDQHDPRGCPSYVKNYIENCSPTGHLPHPNIVDWRQGRLCSQNFTDFVKKCATSSDKFVMTTNTADSEDELSEAEKNEDDRSLSSTDLPEEFQIPIEAVPWK